MRATPWTEEHDRLMLDAAPQVPESSDVDLARVWNRVAGAMEGDSQPRRRKARIVVGALVGAVVLGTSGIAAAELYSAYTGQGPVDAEDLRLGGPGERLDPAAPDYGQIVAQETADIPFPSLESREFAVQAQVHDARFAVPGSERLSVGALRAWVADAALCAWSNEWAAATRDDKAADRAEAIGMVQQAPTWPAVVAIDPDPYSRMETQDVTDEKGVTRTERYRDESQFYYVGALGRAVQGRNLDAVAALLAENNGYCRPELVPDIPRAYALFAEH
ncbi:hypothetical protein NPS01_13470 [Nocardioides psychrotolerans]|uniref:Uncharacterized protein n=1 Tax=Nocardioides psychrotolerans TaxID=1005945 RepID=A0A1I3HAF1_9ACTN|nr:hypothetical protein [Nocardioides psychrotolerans]GEP37684.1 hypothetical protein NPS01_13470 [Nocardioides psychrotolerans]SFI32716.1 hypothetical protein SAMN05216561_10799 [Nocardioides psychrotolerans]